MYCYVFTSLKKFKYEFANCKPSKKQNMCFVSVKLSLLFSLLLCHCSHLTNRTIITAITFLQAQMLIRYSLFRTQLVFTQDWLNYNWLLAALSHLQSTECSQSRRFMILPSRELYRDSLCIFIIILICPFLPHAYCYCFIWKVFHVFVSVYCLHIASYCVCVFYIMLLVVYL